MQSVAFEYPHDKAAMYHILKTQLQGLTDGVPHLTANLANASALLNQALEDINWVGFYLLEGEPVSYTHLDVYKRQGEALAEYFNCLIAITIDTLGRVLGY